MTTKEHVKLKPCPFCSDDEITLEGGHAGDTSYYQCGNCGGTVETKWWNTRHDECALTAPEDLRKLAEEIFDDATGEAYDRNPDYLEADVRPIAVGKIITALQTVQRAEREKAEGVREALLNVVGLMDGAPEDVVGYIKQELAAYEASKET